MVARRTEVEVQDDWASVRVKANLVQLQQVILNLLVNAADAMNDIPPKQRRVEIAVAGKARMGIVNCPSRTWDPAFPLRCAARCSSRL